MKNEDEKFAEQVALFRYGLIADLVTRPVSAGELQCQLDEKSAQTYLIPGTTRTRVAEGTLRDWIRLYKAGEFDALKPRCRKDCGIPRSIPVEVMDKLVTLKEDQPKLSVRALIAKARFLELVETGQKLPQSTIDRHLKSRGLVRMASVEPIKDRRKFGYARAGELWMSDVMHGPSVAVGNGRHKTYLIGFIDDATRMVPFLAFCLSENVVTFMPVLKQALLRRGVPLRLFVDNGSNYRSHHLAVVCARLGINLIHAAAYSPESKGKQERFWRTLREAFLHRPEVVAATSLEELNRLLWAWVEGEYHEAAHRGLDGESPLQAWTRTADTVRYLPAQLDVEELFLMEVRRHVNRDRTVSINAKLFEVDAALVGQTIALRFDPTRLESSVRVYEGSKQVSVAKLVDTLANASIPRDRPAMRFATKKTNGEEG